MSGPARTGFATALAARSRCTRPCGNGGGSTGRQQLTLWFWGAPPSHQKTMEQSWSRASPVAGQVRPLGDLQQQRRHNVQVALAANKGPDVVYSSGPSFAAVYAAAASLLTWAVRREVRWKSSVSVRCTTWGRSAASSQLPNSVNTYGVFLQQRRSAGLGPRCRPTFAQLVDVMNRAKAAGMYASVTGNKGWKPVNLDYASIFLNHDAGPGAVYDAVAGKIRGRTPPWSGPSGIGVSTRAAIWAGRKLQQPQFDHPCNCSPLADRVLSSARPSNSSSPPTTFNDAAGIPVNLGFAPFPGTSTRFGLASLCAGTTASLSVNASSPNKDGAAEVINYNMSERFFNAMRPKSWPATGGCR